MANLARKFRRQKKKKLAKEVGIRMSLFNKLPTQCNLCPEPFDKTDREMVRSWHVVSYDKEGQVHLFCPPCWQGAIEGLQDNIKTQMAEIEKTMTQLGEGEEND